MPAISATTAPQPTYHRGDLVLYSDLTPGDYRNPAARWWAGTAWTVRRNLVHTVLDLWGRPVRLLDGHHYCLVASAAGIDVAAALTTIRACLSVGQQPLADDQPPPARQLGALLALLTNHVRGPIPPWWTTIPGWAKKQERACG